MKILYVNACVREESRTRMLAEYFLEQLQAKYADEIIETCEVILEKENIEPLSRAGLDSRNKEVSAGDYSNPKYDNARKLLEADMLLVAAPYWDLSFPSYIKLFFESVTIDGLTFHYTEEGFPEGFSKADKLVYITTAGGPIISDEYGFGYIRDLSKFYYGIPEAVQFKAENLDVIDSDVPGILNETKREIKEYMGSIIPVKKYKYK